MNSELSYRFFTKLGNDSFSFIYLGEFDDALTSTLIRINETAIDESAMFKKRLSFLIAECFQNIIRHADTPKIVNRTNNKPKMFLVRNIENEYYLASTNLIDNTKKEGLESKLKSINTLSIEELKAEYLKSLAHNEFSDKGGGGLGLIEMARKSNCKLQYDFEFVNYFFSNFYMQFRVTPSKEQKDDSAELITLNRTKEFYNSMLAENILMIRKGDFSQESILPLLRLIENNLNSQQQASRLKKKTLYLLVELLQNISKHAKEIKGLREGIFIISAKNDGHILTTGNYIDADKAEVLKNKLDKLAGMDENGLVEVYKNNLLKKEGGPQGSAEVGLIEMSKYSAEKLKYNFIPVTDTTSFFSISIAI